MRFFVHYYVTNAINFSLRNMLHDVTSEKYDNSYNQFLMITALPTCNAKGKTFPHITQLTYILLFSSNVIRSR